MCIILYSATYSEASASERPAILHSIHQTDAPVITDSRLVYAADLRFSAAPEAFWVYYDKQTQELVLDIYDKKVVKNDSVKRHVINGDIFGEVDIITRESEFSINGMQTQVRVVMATGWHYKAELVNPYAIRLTVWKHLRTPLVDNGRIRPFAYLGSAIAIAALSFFGVSFFINSK